MTAAIQAEQSL